MRKKKIKILHVAQAAGGVDRYIRMLLKYLDKEKFENILVCSQDFNREDYDGLVDSFEQIEMNRAIGVSDLSSIKEVRKLIKKYSPDIVYAHSSKAGAIARVEDIGLKNHCVYNPHGWAFNMRCSDKKRAMYTAIEKMAAPFCEKIICISDAEKQSALEKKVCRDDKLQVIFNGVDIEAYDCSEHGKVKRADFIHMYFVAFCALVLYEDDYNNFKSYLICAGGALAVSEIYSWMKNISNRSTTVSRLKHD